MILVVARTCRSTKTAERHHTVFLSVEDDELPVVAIYESKQCVKTGEERLDKRKMKRQVIKYLRLPIYEEI